MALALSFSFIMAAGGGGSGSASDPDPDVSPSSIGVDPLVIDVVLDRDETTSEQFTISNNGEETFFFDFNIIDTTDSPRPGPLGSIDTGPKAVPLNDDFPGTVVREPSFIDTQDTTEATIEPDEEFCRGFTVSSTVWYNVTPAEDGLITAHLQVPFTGEGSISAITGRFPNIDVKCDLIDGGHAEVSFRGLAGRTYYFQAGGRFGYKFMNFALDVSGGIGNDLTWVSVDPDFGLVSPGGSQDISLNFDSAGLDPGVYTAELLVNSDAPDDPQPVVVQVSLTVEPPEITVDPLSLDKAMPQTRLIPKPSL